jgi:hypothetical protein
MVILSVSANSILLRLSVVRQRIVLGTTAIQHQEYTKSKKDEFFRNHALLEHINKS